MKNILLIGVGGTGSNAVDILYSKINELGNQTNSNISAIVFDTDVGSVETIKSAVPVSMADPASVGTICDRVGLEYIREWFPCDDKAVRSQEMVRGASQWRKKSYLAFLNLMNKPQARSKFIGALEDMSKDPSATCEVYVIASIAGGTGSGSFIPIALFARRYLRKQLGKNPIVNAMVALPDIYADAQTEDNRIKIYSNAYAILRELNAIYLVARNFNAGENRKVKKAPVKFRIGNPNEPNVGVLFDSEDPQFWTPEAAPFTQIFVLDRIPGLKSISAHDIVLANSLYTLICTEIGVEFDSEASNHEILRSQNNGSNAIYASVATSQMVFPVDSVLDYLAHDKAVSACDGEWLVLHKAVETEMQKKQQESADMGRKYIAQDGEYAAILLEELKKQQDDNTPVADLIERSTTLYDEEGKPLEDTTAEIFFKKIEDEIKKKILSFNEAKKVSESEESASRTLQLKLDTKTKDKKKVKTTFVNSTKKVKESLEGYFQDCVNSIKRLKNSIPESIITFDKNKYDKNKLGGEGNALSIVDGLLKKDKNFIHPVAAMVQLCKFRKLIPKTNTKEWEAIIKRDRQVQLPDALLNVEGIGKGSKSAYYNLTDRFVDIYSNNGIKYKSSKDKTDLAVDKAKFEADVETVAANIKTQSVNQLKHFVYKTLTKDVDLLIDKYKNFFARFEKEKEDLIEDRKTALRKDSGLIDSVLNIYSTEKEKELIRDKVFKTAGPEDEKSLVETDNLIGKGVFASVYGAAYSAKNETEFNEKDAAAYRSLFANMISAYKTSIKNSDTFKLISSFNIVEAMEASCEDSARTKDSLFGEYFSQMQSLATPSLKIDKRMELGDLVQPSTVIVFMMSYETGRYIKKHADELKLPIPKSENKEGKIIKACAEAFIRKYSGNDTARVSIVKELSNGVIYCTGEIMDITPLRIAKFNELSTENDNLYYNNYCRALKNFKHYKTDMWNPHIGNNLYQRGCLPFMNEEKEDLEDIKMVKALIHALASEQIIYEKGLTHSTEGHYFRAVIEGVKTTIRGANGKVVNTKNMVEIINWLRNQDDIVDKWSAEFDLDIEAQKNSLPSLTTDSSAQRSVLASAITKTRYLYCMRECLFRTEAEKISILEFIYMIKSNEEATRDCDYAERILKTCYAVFKDIIGFRANQKTNPEVFVDIYTQQLEKVFEALASSKTVKSLGADCENFLKQIIGWFETQNAFVLQPLNSEDDSAIKEKFTIEKFEKVASIIKATKKEKAEKENK